MLSRTHGGMRGRAASSHPQPKHHLMLVDCDPQKIIEGSLPTRLELKFPSTGAVSDMAPANERPETSRVPRKAERRRWRTYVLTGSDDLEAVDRTRASKPATEILRRV